MEGIDKRELKLEEQSEFLLDQKCFETWVGGKVGLYSGIAVKFNSNNYKSTLVCNTGKPTPSKDKRLVFSGLGVLICKKGKVCLDETTENIVEFLCERGDSILSDTTHGAGYYNFDMILKLKRNHSLWRQSSGHNCTLPV